MKLTYTESNHRPVKITAVYSDWYLFSRVSLLEGAGIDTGTLCIQALYCLATAPLQGDLQGNMRRFPILQPDLLPKNTIMGLHRPAFLFFRCAFYQTELLSIFWGCWAFSGFIWLFFGEIFFLKKSITLYFSRCLRIQKNADGFVIGSHPLSLLLNGISSTLWGSACGEEGKHFRKLVFHT